MTDPQEATPKATRQSRLTSEQREQQNLRARQRRAAAKAAKASTDKTSTCAGPLFSSTALGASQVLESSSGTIGHQQSLRDRPFQHQLSNLLQAQDKARAIRIRDSQERQASRKVNEEN